MSHPFYDCSDGTKPYHGPVCQERIARVPAAEVARASQLADERHRASEGQVPKPRFGSDQVPPVAARRGGARWTMLYLLFPS